jgi:hypothetical protein
MYEIIHLVLLNKLHHALTANEIADTQVKIDVIEIKMLKLAQEINTGYELLQALGIEYSKKKGFNFL